MVSDPFNSKIVDFLRQNAGKFVFLDKMFVGDHSKRSKSEAGCSGERERGQEREFAGCFVFNGLISDRIKVKLLIFCVQMP